MDDNDYVDGYDGQMLGVCIKEVLWVGKGFLVGVMAGVWSGRFYMFFVEAVRSADRRESGSVGMVQSKYDETFLDAIDQIFIEVFPGGLDEFFQNENFTPDDIRTVEVVSRIMTKYPNINTNLNDQLYIIVEEAIANMIFTEIKHYMINRIYKFHNTKTLPPTFSTPEAVSDLSVLLSSSSLSENAAVDDNSYILSIFDCHFNSITNELESAYFTLILFLTQPDFMNYFISHSYKGYINFIHRSENTQYVIKPPS